MSQVEHTHAALLRLCHELQQRAVARLPPERDLAARLGTSRTTVRKALDALEREGMIRRVRGRAGGAYLSRVTPAPLSPEEAAQFEPAQFETAPFCSGRPLQRSLGTVKGIPQLLHEQGFRDGTRVISAGIGRPSPRAAQHLGLSPDTEVVSLLRLRFADGDTLSLERMYLAGERCTGILGTALDSVYELLRSKLGVTVSVTDESIELATIGESVGTLLGQAAGTPVLRLERVGYDQHERPVEYSVDLFRADRTRFSGRRTA